MKQLEKANAISFFEKEIEELTRMTRGGIGEEYKSHLNNKIQNYKIAVEAIKNEQMGDDLK